MKNILLLVHDDDGQDARLQCALDLTRALEGHLTCIGVTPAPAIAGDVYGGFADTAVLCDERESEAKNRDTLTAKLTREDVRWSWHDATGAFADCILDVAALSDLIILNRALEDALTPNMHAITSRILMHARTPVAAVPEGQERFDVAGRALVAWDGRASASTTLRACVPLLRLAAEVEVFTVQDGVEAADPADAAAYLSRHGVHATIRSVRADRRPPDAMIAEEVERWRADYIVMGAYSRGRWMEAFGGVTKRMLRESPVPLILGH